jgi:DedD protein
MDEQVKARLIGATVLVAVIVILVPAVLSGPKRDATGPAAPDGKRATRTYTIDLGGAVASGARLQQQPQLAPPVREAPRLPTVEPPGVATEPVADLPEEEAPAAPPSPAKSTTLPAEPAPQPVPRTVAAAPAAKGTWSVQVGAFGSADSARRLVADLRKDGLPAYVAPLSRNGKTLHRVRVGPEPTRAAAEAVAARLKGRSLPATVVAAD